MNRYLEYLKLIPKGIPSMDSIVEGVINNVELHHKALPHAFKNEIIRRRIICTSCPFNNVNAKSSDEYFKLTGKHYKSNRKKLHCSFCGCPINIKTASLSSNCGIEDWNNENKNNSLELKWKSFE